MTQAQRQTQRRLYDGDTFDHRGHTFKVEYSRDDDMREPWKENDCHGVVSEWTSRDKAPGERVLVEDRSHKRYYDVQASMRRARKDQWGPIHCATCGEESSSDTPGGWQAYAKGVHATEKDHAFKRESAGQQAARAVEKDYDYLRAWCHDEWEWTNVHVILLDDDEEETNEEEWLGGCESGYRDNGRYLTEVAYELADEILARVEVDDPLVQLSEN